MASSPTTAAAGASSSSRKKIDALSPAQTSGAARRGDRAADVGQREGPGVAPAGGDCRRREEPDLALPAVA